MLPLLSISLKANSEYIKTLTVSSRCHLSVKRGLPPAYVSIGCLLCCFGLLLCLFSFRGYMTNDLTWPFLLVKGVGITILGSVITVCSEYLTRHESKSE